MALGGSRISSTLFSDKMKVAGGEIKWYVLLLKYISVAVNGLGYLALTWSAVVLLGGFITILPKKDFWYLTLLSLVQALRVFNAFNDAKFLRFIWVFHTLILAMIYRIKRHRRCTRLIQSRTSDDNYIMTGQRYLLTMFKASLVVIAAAIFLMLSAMFLLLSSLIVFGLSASLVVPLIRLVKQDYGDNDGYGSKTNLKPALNIFYSLTFSQGLLYWVWYFLLDGQKVVVVLVSMQCKFGKWGYESAWGFLREVRDKCEKDPSSTHGFSLVAYALDMLESESPDKFLSGARMVDTFFIQGMPIAPLVRSSRHKIQKLLGALGWRGPDDMEIRVLSARIVANLARDLHLCELPGSIKLISSLLESTNENYDKEDIVSSSDSTQEDAQRRERERESLLIRVTEKLLKPYYQVNSVANTKPSYGDLIIQGLLIIERLAHDEHNCKEICNTDGLLSKITAPMYSETLVHDIFTKKEEQDIKYDAWIDMVNGSMKVVSRLIRAPTETSRRLCCDISGHKAAVSNMKKILKEAHHLPELQARAIEILAELVLHTSTDMSMDKKRRDSVVAMLVDIFLDDQRRNGRDENATVLRQRAGDALALLCVESQNSKLIFHLQGHGDIITRITKILDNANESIVYKIRATEILEHLCVNFTVDKTYVENTLLPMILRELLQVISEADTQDQKGADSNMIPDTQNDEENPHPLADGHCRSPHQRKEKETDKTKLQAAALSLITVTVIRAKLISANQFANAIQKVIPGDSTSAFLGKVKEMVERNSHRTPDCLRILKLTAEMIVWMLEVNVNGVNGNVFNRGHAMEIIKSLSKASEIMSDLERCMIFAAPDEYKTSLINEALSGVEDSADYSMLSLCRIRQLKVRPLYCDLIKQAEALTKGS